MVTTNIDYVAEIGLNHNGCIDLAKSQIDLAKASGATCVKFQNYYPDVRCPTPGPLRELLNSCFLSLDDLSVLRNHCIDIDIGFSSTPFCVRSAAELIQLEPSFIKVASFHIQNSVLLQYLCKHYNGRIVLSTGVSSLTDIETAFNIFSPHLIPTLLHCISQYPVNSPFDLHLSNIPFLLQRFNCPVGLSDHSLGSNAGPLATILGATFIEKHFTSDNTLTGPDQAMSATPDIFSQLVRACQYASASLGTPRSDTPYECESEILPFVVRS